MRIIQFGLVCLISFLVAGCGVSVSSNDYEVNGKPAREYYEQFLYRHVQGEDLPYFYLHSLLDPLGNGAYLAADLFLLEGGRYVFVYKELGSAARSRKVVRGSWNVDGVRLVLSELGEAHGLEMNGKSAIDIAFSRNLGEGDLKKRSRIFHFAGSSRSLEEAIEVR